MGRHERKGLMERTAKVNVEIFYVKSNTMNILKKPSLVNDKG